MGSSRVRSGWLFLAVVLAGCPGTPGLDAAMPDAATADTPSSLDAGTDAAMEDAPMPDVPAAPGYLQPCAAGVCAAGLRCATEFPRPFCTRTCASDVTCGSGAYCIEGACWPSCRSGRRDCDGVGGSCTVLDISFCQPACDAPGLSTSGCPAGLTCDRDRGVCTTRLSAGGTVGAACTSDAACRSGTCIGPENGYYNGYCVVLGRSTGARYEGCPSGSIASYQAPIGDTVPCGRTCARTSDCRTGYYCGAYPGAPSGFCAAIDCNVAGLPACPGDTRCTDLPDGSRPCLACERQCSARTCGADGCGGTCGTCGSGFACSSAGRCECAPESDAALCAAAGANCGGIMVTDRCGGARSVTCGSCTAPQSCGIVTENVCGCIAETDAELCASRSAECGPLSITDRCGVARTVSCGTCELPETCAGGGVANVCDICVPNCSGRNCGSDGCGGSCGTCSTGNQCNASGICEPIPCDPVANTFCPTGQRCEWTGPGTRTACIVAGPGRAGDSCIFANECAAQFTCTGEDFCREYCTSDSHCSAGRCAYNLTGSSYGLCSRPCSPTATTSGCDFGEACHVLNASRATEVTDCSPEGSASVGGSCGSSLDCRSGLACISSRCRRICTLGSSCGASACGSVPSWTTYGVCP